jgi:hypothetical protein
MIKLLCKVCYKEFFVYNYRRNNANFCSYKCYWKHLSSISGPNKGIRFNKGWRENLSKASKGRHKSLKTEFKQGFKWPDEIKEKMKGRVPWNKNKELYHLSGVNSVSWKGDFVCYDHLHRWIRKIKGHPTKCLHCGITNKDIAQKLLHWANIDHKYKRDPNDFISLCSSCHKKYDSRFNKN